MPGQGVRITAGLTLDRDPVGAEVERSGPVISGCCWKVVVVAVVVLVIGLLDVEGC